MKEINKYQIIKKLGNGQFGTAYKVLDRALNAEKALKVISCSNAQEIIDNLNEAQVLYQCRHKHIVNVNEANVYQINNQPHLCIDMELVNGGSVEEILNKRYLSVVESIRILINVLHGLEHAHNMDYLHRDIKPGNILVDNTCAKVSDFGLAYELKGNSSAPCFGYISHFAPESFQNNTMTKQTDVYAAGVTLFRMVNNYSNWIPLVESIQNYEAKLKNGTILKSIGYQSYVPKRIMRIINTATNPNTAKRYKTVIEFRQALEKLRPKIKWNPQSDFHWTGRDLTDNRSIIELLYDSKRNIVIYKKNKRADRSKSKSVASDIAAKDYINKYVSEHTIG
jgi:eukaryotic-like serine/threonine-protein kinase